MTRRRQLLVGFALLSLIGLNGCRSTEPLKPEPLIARFYLEAKPGDAGVPIELPVSRVQIAIAPKPVLVEHDIVNAEVAKVELGECLLLQLTPAAARDLYRLSVSNVGRRLVLSLNDALVGARVIDHAITDGVILIFLESTDAELLQIVRRLKHTSVQLAYAATTK